MQPPVQTPLPWLVLRHVEHEHLGTVARALDHAGQPYQYLDVFRGDPVPENLFGSLGSLGPLGLIVMGGPMSVYEADRYPFLKEEMRLIRQATETGLPVLGICLGAQLIAGALGARVYPGPRKEIGWYPVEVTDQQDDLTAVLPSRFMAFHWHGDTFDLPDGAVRLFRSDLYENQGFRWGKNVYAIQFHFEVNPGMIEDWLEDSGCQAELAAVPEVMPEMIRQQTAEWGQSLEEMSGKVFRRFVAKAAMKTIAP
ncbi:MAG: gamma-glutamyl-gamma-aminobutyrate hydrolase family protein [Acidobacteria bacterium]|nr:gamma-glutamyl-gamma-aminobutyrate hydrolase family protein [Acidobacteriota bacterium]